MLALTGSAQSATTPMKTTTVTVSSSKWQVVKNALGLFNHQNVETGDTLSNRWWQEAGPFRNGVSVVRFRKKENFLLEDGTILLNQWYHMVHNDKGILIVWKSDQWFNFADITFKGLVLYNKWFWTSEYDNILARERKRKEREIKKRARR